MATDASLLRADVIFNLTVSPIMMLLSLVSNLLAFLVLWRRSFCTMPMSVYLRFLAVMDAGTVITGLLPRFVLALTDYDLRGRNELSCQCQVYIVYVFTELSAWTLVIVTAERVLSIVKPHRVKIMCTKDKSYVIIAVACVLILSSNSPIFVFFGKQAITKSQVDVQTVEDGGLLTGGNNTSLDTANKSFLVYRPCGFRDNMSQSGQAWFLTHFVKQSLLPFILIFSLNIVIIVALIRRRSALLKSCVERFNSLCPNKDSKTRSAEVGHLTMSRRDASLSVTLVSINAVFLICNFPIGIYQQIVFNLPDRYENSDQSLVYSILVFCLYLNNTLNFILYSATGSRFRKELRDMFTCST